MLRECAQTAIIKKVEQKNHGFANMKNFMPKDYAKIVISINTIRKRELIKSMLIMSKMGNLIRLKKIIVKNQMGIMRIFLLDKNKAILLMKN